MDNIPKPIKDVVFIEADPEKNAIKTLAPGVDILIDTAFEPHATETVTQDGTVLQPPSRLRGGGNVDLKAGDKVYTHHFLCDEDQALELEGKKFYQLAYQMCYCRIREGKMKMLGDWNFIEPIEDKKKTTESGIIYNFTPDKEPQVGVAKHINEDMRELGVKEGDLVYFTINSDYEILVEGEKFWRMRNVDIIGIKE